jgi:hypothetical protein
MSYLVDMLIWVLATFGLATIIVNSTIMAPFRAKVEKLSPFFGKLVNCILCTGFWSGVFWSSMYWNPFTQYSLFGIMDALFAGCLGTATTWLIYLKVYPLMQGH